MLLIVTEVEMKTGDEHRGEEWCEQEKESRKEEVTDHQAGRTHP